MSNRDKLRDAIAAEATAVVAQNQPVNIAALALELSSRYPQSGITLDQICAEIETALREAQEVAQIARIDQPSNDLRDPDRGRRDGKHRNA